MKNNPQYLIVHHTGGSDADPLQDSSGFTFEQCNQLHKERFNFISSMGFYVGYHYYIDGKGITRQARLDTDEGAHTIGYNDKSIGICIAGNFDLKLPTIDQTRALQTILRDKVTQYGIAKSNIVPHRTFAPKTCYGRNLPDTWAMGLVDTMVLSPKFTKEMGYGSFGSQVLLLQKKLVSEGYGNFTPTGFFGEKTFDAVMTYQVAKGIITDSNPEGAGHVGPRTLISLNQ